jgi:hypothetical protein
METCAGLSENPPLSFQRSLKTRDFTMALHRRDSCSPHVGATGIFVAVAKIRVLYWPGARWIRRERYRLPSRKAVSFEQNLLKTKSKG